MEIGKILRKIPKDWCGPLADMTRPNYRAIFFLTIAIFLLVSVMVLPRGIRFKPLNDFATPRLPVVNSTRINTGDKVKDSLQSLAGSNRSLTVVSGFFDIGNFPKGSLASVRTPKKYENWMRVFARVKNPVVLYTDSQAFATLFANIRNGTKYLTKIVVINRNTLWSFQIMPKIAKLYSMPGYPKHYPNTFLPSYTALTHSKVPVVHDAIQKKYFSTDYYCWLDIGYFRDIVTRNKTFWLEVPNGFDPTKVGVTRVYNSKLSDIRPKTIIYGNLNWIGGGLFLGKPDVLVKFARQYKFAVMRYLNESLMNVEQQILYSMFTTEERKAHPLDVDVQLYIPGTKKVMSGNPWFYLGYLMYDEL